MAIPAEAIRPRARVGRPVDASVKRGKHVPGGESSETSRCGLAQRQCDNERGDRGQCSCGMRNHRLASLPVLVASVRFDNPVACGERCLCQLTKSIKPLLFNVKTGLFQLRLNRLFMSGFRKRRHGRPNWTKEWGKGICPLTKQAASCLISAFDNGCHGPRPCRQGRVLFSRHIWF